MLKVKFLCFLVQCLARFSPSSTAFLAPDEDAKRNTSELIASKGYPVEEHTVTTKDSYLIWVQRIPTGRAGSEAPSRQRRPVVFLMTGLHGTSADYVANMPDQSPGFILADHGFDVWLGNVRGSKYSSHQRLSKKNKAFWDFSFDEMIEYDLPAQIDAILHKTEQQALLYVGWSQGTLIMFGLLASRPEYNGKVLLFNAFAPVAFLGHMTSKIRTLLPFADTIEKVLQLFLKGGAFKKQSIAIDAMKKLSCGRIRSGKLCRAGFYFLNGGFPIEMNQTRLPVYLAFEPTGTSVRNWHHYAQIIKSNRFHKYDWGRKRNIEIYGKPWPPQYELSNVKAPVALYWSDGDVLATPRDVAEVARSLPNVVLNYKVPVPGFTHVDFGWSIRGKEHVYKKMLEMVIRYSRM